MSTTPSIAELLRALPQKRTTRFRCPRRAGGGVAARSGRRWRRMRLLGTLQAKIAVAYLFYWIRGWFQEAGEQKLLLAETHWRTALRLLDSMSYLRGAAMKVGQTLANFPDIVPSQFVDKVNQLHFDAPPMHWSLLREMVRTNWATTRNDCSRHLRNGHSQPLRWDRCIVCDCTRARTLL